MAIRFVTDMPTLGRKAGLYEWEGRALRGSRTYWVSGTTNRMYYKEHADVVAFFRMVDMRQNPETYFEGYVENE